MSDAQPSPVETKTTSEPTAAEPASAPAAEPAATPAGKISPVVVMTFVIVVLLTALVVMGVMPDRKNSEIEKLQAELASYAKQSSPAATLGGGEQIGDVAARMKKDADTVALLAERYQQLVDETHGEAVRKVAELARSEELRKRDYDTVLQLRKELDAAKGAGYETEALRREVARLKEELASAGAPEEIAVLGRQLQEARSTIQFLEARVKELEAQLASQQQKLFASTEDELLRPALALVRTLRGLEGKSDSEIATAYSQIGVDLGARVVKTLSFATGSAEMNPIDAQEVGGLLQTVSDGDMLLVVGYASITGQVDANRVLSSDRATAVAAALTNLKSPGQLVQAMYLGQTDRFSSRIPERNQITEVWHIRKDKQ